MRRVTWLPTPLSRQRLRRWCWRARSSSS